MNNKLKYWADGKGNIFDLAHRIEKLWNEIEEENEPEIEPTGIITKCQHCGVWVFNDHICSGCGNML